MSGEKRHRVLGCCAKKWDPIFSSYENAENSNPYLESRKEIGADGDEWSIFLRDSESGPSNLVEEVLEFVKDFPSDAKWQEECRDAWLDDRSCRITSSKGVRTFEKFLRPAALEQHLSIPRFSHPEIPDADRRVIQIKNLSPAYMLALFNTASIHEVSVLRDAFWNHIASQISIRVKVPPKTNPVFHLKLHLPYPALRPGHPQDKASHEWQSKWEDLSFLKKETSDKAREIHGIYRAHISLVISGPSDWRWVAYGFDSHDFDDEDSDVEDSEDDESEGEDFEGNDLQDGDSPFVEDPMAEVDANKPIYNAREYFSLIFQTKMARALDEWKHLVRWVERNINAYRDQDSFPLSKESETAGYQPKDEKKTYDWTQKARGLLSRLVNDLSATIKEWESFGAPDGDICYFYDFDSSQATSRDSVYGRLCRIKEMFDELQALRQKLIELQDSCHKLTKDLKLRLILQSKEAALQSNEAVRQANEAARQFRVITELAARQAEKAAKQNRLMAELSVWFIAPLALTTAYFSMPPAVIPFTMNTKSFFISIFAVLAMMRLFLIVLGVLPFSWRKVDPPLKAEPMNRTDFRLSRFEKFCRFVLRRKFKGPVDVEMGVVGR